jgi:hypothetical protein
MLKKLRTLLAASLLVTTLVANANAFTTDSDNALTRPTSAVCWIYFYGMWLPYEC